MGITVGFALGIPLTSYLADQFSLEMAFLFGAFVNTLAFIGILLLLPSMPVKEKCLSANKFVYSANQDYG